MTDGVIWEAQADDTHDTMSDRNDKDRSRRSVDAPHSGQDPIKQVASLAARLSDSIRQILDRSSALMLRGRYEEALNLLESMETEMQRHPVVIKKIKEAQAKVQEDSDFTGVDRPTVVRDPGEKLLQECESRDPEDPTMVRDPHDAPAQLPDETDFEGPTAVRDPDNVLRKRSEAADYEEPVAVRGSADRKPERAPDSVGPKPAQTETARTDEPHLPPLTIEKTAKVKPLEPPHPDAMAAGPAPSRWTRPRQLVVVGSAAGLVTVVLLLIVVAGTPRSSRKRAKRKDRKSDTRTPESRMSRKAPEPRPGLARRPDRGPVLAEGRKTKEEPVRPVRKPVRPAQKLEPVQPAPRHEWVRLRLTVNPRGARPVVTFRGKAYPGWKFESPLVEAGSKYEKVIVSAEGYSRVQLRVVVNRNITHKLELKPIPTPRKTAHPPPAPTAPTRVATRRPPRKKKAARRVRRTRPTRKKARARRSARPRTRKKARLFTLD